jgi:hypothetical protein
VRRSSVERELERLRADDRGDDSDLDARLLEYRALLDVQLEVSQQRSRLAACVG